MNRIVCILLILSLGLALSGCTGTRTPPSAAVPSEERPERLPPEEARALLKDWLLQRWPDFNTDLLSETKETDFGIPGLFEDTATQYYVLNLNTYLIHDKAVSDVFRMSPRSATTGDVDGDGREEAVFTGDVGSGRYIYAVFVVKEGVVFKKSVENTGFGVSYRLEKDVSGKIWLVRKAASGEGGVKETENRETVGLTDGEIMIQPAAK